MNGFTEKEITTSVGVGDSFANAIEVTTGRTRLVSLTCLETISTISLVEDDAVETGYFDFQRAHSITVGWPAVFAGTAGLNIPDGLKVYTDVDSRWLIVYEEL